MLTVCLIDDVQKLLAFCDFFRCADISPVIELTGQKARQDQDGFEGKLEARWTEAAGVPVGSQFFTCQT